MSLFDFYLLIFAGLSDYSATFMHSAISVFGAWCSIRGASAQSPNSCCLLFSVQVVQSKNLPPTYYTGQISPPLTNSKQRVILLFDRKWQPATVFTFFFFVSLYLSAFCTSPPAFPLVLASIANTILSICLFFFLLFCFSARSYKICIIDDKLRQWRSDSGSIDDKMKIMEQSEFWFIHFGIK